MRMKQSAVAGLFYPEDPVELCELVDGLLDQHRQAGDMPRALIVPHAGLIYSGAIAARAYNRCRASLNVYQRIVLLGPSHRFPLKGLAVLDADEWQTPLGLLEVDRRFSETLVQSGVAGYDNRAHNQEHCLEVQLPFLQRIGSELPIVAVAVGQSSAEQVADLQEQLLRNNESLVIVSSDLSHFHDYSSACEIDQLTMQNIEQLQPTLLPEQACGCYAVNGLLAAAKRLGLRAEKLAACNSGDTAGSHDRVVGYAAYAFC